MGVKRIIEKTKLFGRARKNNKHLNTTVNKRYLGMKLNNTGTRLEEYSDKRRQKARIEKISLWKKKLILIRLNVPLTKILLKIYIQIVGNI